MSLVPPRLQDDGSPELKRLLASAGEDEPTPAELATLAAALPFVSPPPLAAAPGAPAAVVPAAVKVISAVALAGLVGAAAWTVALRTTERPTPPAPPGVVEALPPAPAEVVPPAEVALSAPPPSPAPQRPKLEAPPSKPDELAQVTAALQALERREPLAALASIERLDRELPEGALAEEREVVRIRALAALGRREEAARALEAFRARFPASGHLGRLDPDP